MKDSPSVGRLIGCIHRHAMLYFDSEMNPFGLSGGSFHYLMILFHKDGISQNELSRRIHFDKANTTRHIKKLMDEGYVRREPDEHDARVWRIFLTDKAHAIHDEIRSVLKGWSALLMEGLSRHEKKTAMALLTRMAENALKVRKQ